MKGRISRVIILSLGQSSILVAIMEGTVQPNPMSMGMKLFREGP